jgi:hypothetical protein
MLAYEPTVTATDDRAVLHLSAMPLLGYIVPAHQQLFHPHFHVNLLFVLHRKYNCPTTTMQEKSEKNNLKYIM